MKHTIKKAISLMLAFCLLLGLMPQLTLPASAASNLENGFEGQAADVFSALGFDTSVLPEGYDAETTDNPYGRDTILGNQVHELLLRSPNGYNITGVDNNAVNPANIGAPVSGGSLGMEMFASAAADFDGDGLPGEVVYAGYQKVNYGAASQLQLRLYDAKTNRFGTEKGLTSVSVTGGTWDYTWQNLLQVTAGDWDGDGTYEIAVYMPESGNARVDIYKYQKTSQSGADDWMDLNNWGRVWSHVLSNSADKVPNMVSLASADLNLDGVDDLAISSGRFESASAYVVEKSTAVVLWGGRSDMLQSSASVDLNEKELGDQTRVSLIAADLDQDGNRELIATGQPVAELQSGGNNTRTITTYLYSSEDGLVINYSGTQKPLDGAWVTGEYDTGSGGQQTTKWQSNNGFDSTYHSLPFMRTNAAAFHPKGSDYPYLYLDSCLYECVEGQFQLKASLDDLSYDNENYLNNREVTSLDAVAWGPKSPSNTSDEEYYYTEYGAVSADLNGEGFDTLATSFYSDDSRALFHDSGLSTLTGSASGILSSKTHNENWATKVYDDLFPIGATMVDADMDTYIIEYTGQHYLTYSDPKVIAVIAAAPYFEDVDEVSGYDYAWQNTTTYATIKGEGDSSFTAMDLEYGNYAAASGGLGGSMMEVESSVNFTLEWVEEETNSTEYVLEFETSQDEDSIAFFSIPTENYVYRILTPDGNGGYIETIDVITRTFAPVNQILTLDYYESIQGNYDSLPQIAGKAITSTPGDPSSYPSSTSGYDVISQWKDDPAGAGFGNGAITQEITVTEEDAKSFNLGAALDFKAGGGINLQSDFFQTEVEVKGGVQFSLNPSGGWTKFNMTGTTISGTVTNMPLEFQQYGYYYNWKIFSYNYEIDEDNKIPVVSYIVNDVSQPPELPEDFQQDYDRTTSSQNVLTWTYDGSFSSFYIYKYFDFPVGGGLQLVKEIPSSTADYTLKYDENGKPYKEYYFIDENLAPYTEYEYAIQVERLSQTPPLSSPSALVAVRTKAANGNPVMHISESDGKNDQKLLVYPDKNSYLTVSVTGPEGQSPASCYTTVQYQWQKKDKGAWTDLVGETNRTMSFVSAGVDTAGEYRCRVNALTNTDATAITSYTSPVSLTHAKRSAYVEEVYVHDVSGGGVELYAKVANGHADSASIPGGTMTNGEEATSVETVTFNLTNNGTGMTYQRVVKLNTAGIASIILDDSLPEGMYSVEAYYSGSFIFKACSGDALYLSQRSSGYDIDVPQSVTYGDGAQVIFRKADKTGGVTAAEEVRAASYALLRGDTLNTRAIAGAVAVPSDHSVTRGNAYYIPIDSIRYYFTASHNGEVRVENGYVIYDADTPITTDYLTFTNKGGKYDLAEDLPAGGYVLRMAGDDGVNNYASFTVERRKLTLQLPTQKGEEGTANGDEPTDAPTVPYGSVSVVSGSWAPCDMPDGTLKSDIANAGIYLDYINTAGKTFSRWSVDSLCGYYTIRAQVAQNANRDNMSNYDVTYLDGSITILGATQEVRIGARPFEGQQVGALYAISPEYASTRTDLSDSNVLIQNHATGTKMVFTAIPDEGYEVYDWYINGVSQGSKNATISCVLLAEDTTVEVQFAIKQNNLIFGTAGDAGGGTIVCDDPDLTSDSSVLANSHFFFTAKANPGYHFKEWRYTETGKGTAYDDSDSGSMESSFELLMPGTSCSVYAVFERDFYTFSYTDRSGAEGLSAWYEGSPTGDSTAATQKIYIQSGDSVKGDTTITVAPKTGYLLDPDQAYVSEGSQGTADYAAGTYTLKLQEDTTVSGYAWQDAYDLTLTFDVDTHDVIPAGAVLTYTIGSEQYTFEYTPETPSITIPDVPGGTAVTAAISYPGYYDLLGFSDLSSQIDGVTGQISGAVRVTVGDPVEKGKAYFFEVVGETEFQTDVYTYYFIADMDGTFGRTNSATSSFRYRAYLYYNGPAYELDAIKRDETITVHLEEKPTHTVTMEDITGKGTYGIELPEGAYQTAGSDNRTLVTVHEGDNFTVLITPEQKWTVSYWRTTPEGGTATQVRATSLKYMIPDITMDFTFAPVFSSTTYNTISWPTVDEERNGLTLSPMSGSLSSVAAGGAFRFKLSGSTLDLVDQVFANGEPFVPEGEGAGDYTYTGDGADRVYTISNIQENKVITATLIPLGVTVNGTDIVAMSGPGWVYDHNTQILTLNRGNLVVSGRSTTYAPELSIVMGVEAVSVVLEDLTMDPYSGTTSTRTALQAMADSVTITVNGHTFMEGKLQAKDLVIRGNGWLELENDNDYVLEATGLNLLNDVILDLLAVTHPYSLKVSGSINVGAPGSTAEPTFRSSRGSISAHSINTYAGMLTVHSRIKDAVYVYDLNNYGGVMDLTAPKDCESIWLEDGNGWRVYYPSGFLVTETTEDGATSTYCKQPNGYSAPFEYDVMGEYKNAGSNKNPSVIVQPLGNSSLPATVQIGRPSDGANVAYDMTNIIDDLFRNETLYEEAYICLAADPFVIRPVVLLPGVAYSETEYQRYKDMGLKAAVYYRNQGDTLVGTMSATGRTVTWESLGDGTWTPSFSYDTESSYDYTLSGVWGLGAPGVGVMTGHIYFDDASVVNSLTLSNMTMLNGSIESFFSYISMRGDNVLYNTDSSYGRPLVTYMDTEIRGDGESTLTLVGYDDSEPMLSVNLLILKDMESVTALNTGAGGAMGVSELYVTDSAVQEYSSLYGGLGDKTVPYGHGWKQDVGANANQSKTQTQPVTTVTNKYTRIYSGSSDAADEYTYFWYDLDLDTFQMSTRIYEPVDNGDTREFERVTVIDSEGSETPLVIGDATDRWNMDTAATDLIWSGRNYMTYNVGEQTPNLYAYESSDLGMPTFKSLEPGWYTLRVYFQDPDPSDATYYYLDMSLEIRRSQTTSNTLSITPNTAISGRNQPVTFTTSYLDRVPSRYAWYVDDVLVEGQTSSTFTCTVPADAEIGSTIQIRAESYEGETRTGYASAELTVTPSAAEINLDCADLTANEDGSYTVRAFPDSAELDFNATATLDNGETSGEVVWTLWGNTLRGTSLDENGMLTIDPKETGTYDTLVVKATYSNADGTSLVRSVAVRLSTDAWVSCLAEENEGGMITGVTADGEAIDLTGAYVPAGSTIVVTAQPEEDNIVSDWFVNGQQIVSGETYTSDRNNGTLTFTAEKLGSYDITATFGPRTDVQITYEAIGEGTVSAEANGEALTSGGRIDMGASVTFTAQPGEYSVIKAWYVDGVLQEGNTGTTLTLTDLAEDHNVTVEFGIATRTISLQAVGGLGDISAAVNGEELAVIDSACSAAVTDPVVLTAVPGEGFEFVGWAIDTEDNIVSLGELSYTVEPGMEDITVCAIFQMPDHVHSYEAQVIEPTCTDMGYTTYTCECGHSYTADPVSALGHEYDWEIIEPTCTAGGYTRYVCAMTDCGHEYVAQLTEALGHSYTSAVTEPTCIAMGYTTYTCECGESYAADYVDATGHTYTSEMTEPTHNTMGYTTHTCACGHSYVDSYTDALEHEYEQTVTKEATCTADGEMTFTCGCGESYTQTIPMTEHSFTAQITAPTCTAMGFTTYVCDCGYSYTADYVDAIAHELEEVTVEPDCLTSGYTQVECTDCGFSSVTEITEPTGQHITHTVGAVEATYTREGYTGDLVCRHCGTVIEVGRVIPMVMIPDVNFVDVADDAWYADAVNYVAEVGLMYGVGSNTFAPDLNTTRAMVVTLLYRLEGHPDVAGIENPFTDVVENAWYYKAVLWASEEGVGKGVSQTLFAPDQTVTREQMVTMLYRYAGEPEADPELLDRFPDGEKVSNYARAAFSWAIENGIISGSQENGQAMLKPQNTATRAQIAAIFMRYIEN